MSFYEAAFRGAGAATVSRATCVAFGRFREGIVLVLMIETLHDLIYQSSRIMGGVMQAFQPQQYQRTSLIPGKAMELDNRGSHFYLALFWAEAGLSFGSTAGGIISISSSFLPQDFLRTPSVGSYLLERHLYYGPLFCRRLDCPLKEGFRIRGPY